MKRHLFYLRYVFIFGLILPVHADAMEESTLAQKAKNLMVSTMKSALASVKRKAKAYGACITGTCQEQELKELQTAGRVLFYTAILFVGVVLIGGPISYAKANEILLYGAAHNNLKLVQSALKLGANKDAQDQFGKTAFMWSIEKQNEDIARLLFNAEVDTSIHDKNGNDARTYGIMFFNQVTTHSQ